MGMTREEIVKSMSVQDAIEVLKDTNTYGTADIAKSVAIDTMRKYQKIEALINSWELGLVDNIGHEISKVLEDGNENNHHASNS
jgi:hypothetical protein